MSCRVMLKILVSTLVIGLGLPSCAILQKFNSDPSTAERVDVPIRVVRVPIDDSKAEAKYESLQEEIKRLEEVIVEKDKLIHSQNIRQKDQDQVLQEVNDEATKVQVKLHRLATKPSAASTIAEVEVAMRRLKQQEISTSDQALQLQAQRMLSAATVFYNNDEYAAAMNYATQAHDIINMILDQDRKKLTSTVKLFYAPVMLKTKGEVNLRKGPDKNSEILGTIKKGTVLTASAYRGDWLQIQTEENARGWIANHFVEMKNNF